MKETDYRKEMDEETAMGIAKLLRKPEGEHAIEVGQKMNQGNKYINLRTIELIPLSPDDSILEIGMGNGFFVEKLFEKNTQIQYTGCDYSEEMVRESIKHNRHLIDQGMVNFVHAEVSELPFDDSTFDHVFTINTIYFWDDHKKVLTEIGRILKPEGILTLALRPKDNMKSFAFTKYGFDMFAASELTNMLKENGFQTTLTVEEEEPAQEINGIKRTVETLIVSAQKIKHG